MNGSTYWAQRFVNEIALSLHVTQVLVCDSRKNALFKVGNKSDRIDSRKLAELLRSNLLRSVYHEDTGIRTVKELAPSYMTLTRDLTRVMVRLSYGQAHQRVDKQSGSSDIAKLVCNLQSCRELICADSLVRANYQEKSIPGGNKQLVVWQLEGEITKRTQLTAAFTST